MFCRVIGAIAIFATLAAIGAVLFSIVDDAPAENQQTNTRTKSSAPSAYNEKPYNEREQVQV
jgi:hypothetical protein